jgi:ribose transport system permease protein
MNMPAVSRAETDAQSGVQTRPIRSVNRALWSAITPARIGGLYILAIMIVVFSIWLPQTFPTAATVQQILNESAIDALASLALVVPLSSGVFDISVPSVMSFTGVVSTYLVVNSHLSIAEAIVIAMVSALVIGVFNGVIVVVLGIESLIATLASGFIIQAIVTWLTNSVTISSPVLSQGYGDIANYELLGVDIQVWYALVLAIVLWVLLDMTASGRRIYATGFNLDAARLAGVRAARIRFIAFVSSGLIAGFAGVVLSSSLFSGQPSGGASYLLPAFAAVFLGATQFRPGRFNSWGTVLAVLLIGTGTVGLSLASEPAWVISAFTGVVLIAALAFTTRERSVLHRLRRSQR